MTDIAASFRVPRWNELPNIELYMDQLIRFVNNNFEPVAEELGLQPLTKSMINNYVKARIVDAPVNKQYSTLSLAMVIVVYLVKTCYTTEDAGKLIRLGIGLEDTPLAYDRFCEAMEKAVSAVFSGEVCIRNEVIPGRENKYLMDNFAQSIASKFFVRSTFCNRKEPAGEEELY
ncbi:MAG: DUF1836 domain-containing protein [Firmicutes bacterium]|nr:DUF1836 domain-containing protein [Bacillota bacterium]